MWWKALIGLGVSTTANVVDNILDRKTDKVQIAAEKAIAQAQNASNERIIQATLQTKQVKENTNKQVKENTNKTVIVAIIIIVIVGVIYLIMNKK